MTKDEFGNVLSSLASGWSERRYEQVAAHFSEDVFYSDPTSYSLTGRRSVLEFFQDDEGYEQSCRFHNAVFDESQQLGAAEYTYAGTHVYHGTVWIKIENGLIAGWREYQHRSEKGWEEFWRTVV